MLLTGFIKWIQRYTNIPEKVRDQAFEGNPNIMGNFFMDAHILPKMEVEFHYLVSGIHMLLLSAMSSKLSFYDKKTNGFRMKY